MQSENLVKLIINEVNLFAGDEPQFDDITLFVIKID